jgi:HD-GYP domain-containing protein (c-di-GMP phosphodiesterase class II)
MSSDLRSGSPSPAAEADLATTERRGDVLLRALDEHVEGAREHANATASYAFATAVQLGLEPDACLGVREAARLHEVGKLYARAELLAGPEWTLSEPQRAELVKHYAAGAGLALGAGVPESICEWIVHAGERFDDAVERDGSAEVDIPLPSRIIAAACEYDRQLARHRDSVEGARRWALIAVIEQSGGAFDPLVVDALARVVERAAERTGG